MGKQEKNRKEIKMEDLIKLWEKRSKKYTRLGREATDRVRVEGLLAIADTYSLCADELRRKLKE